MFWQMIMAFFAVCVIAVGNLFAMAFPWIGDIIQMFWSKNDELRFSEFAVFLYSIFPFAQFIYRVKNNNVIPYVKKYNI